MNKQIIKILVSGTLIFLIAYNVELDVFYENISNAKYSYLGITFILLLVQFPVSTVKWKTSLCIHKLNYSFIYLQIIICIGFFYNNFLPSNIGGDGYRIFKTIPEFGGKSTAISAVLYDRVVGLLSLLFLGLIGSALVFVKERNSISFYYICFSCFTLFSCLLIIFIFKTQNISIKTTKFTYINNNIKTIITSGSKNLHLVLFSMLFQVIAVGIFFVTFKAFGVVVSFEKCAVITAISSLSAVLPLSINGIGILEGSIVIASVQMGIDYESAVATSVILRFLLVPLSLFCGLFCFVPLDKFRKEKVST